VRTGEADGSYLERTRMRDPVMEKIRQVLDQNTLPPMIIMDITNVCNLRCTHCPRPELQAREDFKAQHLSWEHFERVIEQVRGHGQPCLLRFVGDGEPLLHPRLLPMLEIAKSQTTCIVNLTTNGTLLSQEKADRILDTGIDLIDVSVDALTKPTYEKVRRGGSYVKLMRNLFHLLDARAAKDSHTKVMVSFIEQDDNSDEVEPFRAFWTPLVDYVMIRRLHSAAGQVKVQESRERNLASEQERYPCPHLWKRLTVDYAGRIKFCAHDWGIACVLGNVADSDLRSIWQGPELSRLREDHLSGNTDACGVCKDCSDWASSKWDWGYERLIDRVVMGKPVFLPGLPMLDSSQKPF
jgi:radical SAM protein with 4Fe4S-binding SPASM domain